MQSPDDPKPADPQVGMDFKVSTEGDGETGSRLPGETGAEDPAMLPSEAVAASTGKMPGQDEKRKKSKFKRLFAHKATVRVVDEEKAADERRLEDARDVEPTSDDSLSFLEAAMEEPLDIGLSDSTPVEIAEPDASNEAFVSPFPPEVGDEGFAAEMPFSPFPRSFSPLSEVRERTPEAMERIMSDNKETRAQDGASDPAETPEIVDFPDPLVSQSIVKNYVIGSMALGLVPVPVFDIVAVTASQLKMIHDLARQYDVPFVENVAKTLVLSLLAGVLPVTMATGFTSLLKMIPGLGSISGGASVSILAGSLTYAVGTVFVQHFESGGTLLDFDPAKVRDHFRREVKQGRAQAAAMGREAAAN